MRSAVVDSGSFPLSGRRPVRAPRSRTAEALPSSRPQRRRAALSRWLLRRDDPFPKRGTTGGKLCACASRTPARKACEPAESAVCAAVVSAHASVGAVAYARVLRPQYWESEAWGCPPLQCACAAPPPAGPRRDRCGAAEPGRAPGR